MASIAIVPPPPTHFCHLCNDEVRPSPMADDVLCPQCNGGFLEEIEVTLQPPQSQQQQDFLRDPASLFQLLEAVASVMHAHHLPGPHLGTGGLEFVFEAGGGNDRRVGADLGDYFFGADFEQLLQHLAEHDPSRYGTPPASKSAVEGLPTLKISSEHLTSDSASCAVCKDDFEIGNEVKQMPCKHMYHPGCILPWLNHHNSCPVCRYELPSEDLDYNQLRNNSNNSSSSSSSGSNSSSGDDNNISSSNNNNNNNNNNNRSSRFADFMRVRNSAGRGFNFLEHLRPWIFSNATEGSGSDGDHHSDDYHPLRDVD